LQAFGTVFASKIDRRVSQLRNFRLTAILLYTEIPFEVPKHQPYGYIIILYIWASVQYLVLRVCKLYSRSIVASLDYVLSS
jgi:hypothetical protein